MGVFASSRVPVGERETAQGLRRGGASGPLHAALAAVAGPPAGMRRAPHHAMATKATESWTIPLHIVMWTVITVGFIMMLVVLMMK